MRPILKGKWRYVVAFFVALPLASAGAVFADSVRAAEDPSPNVPFHVRLRSEGSGVFFDRGHKFEIGQIGDWGQRRGRGDGLERNLRFDHDVWGGRYGIDLDVHTTEKASLGVSFEQAFSRSEITSHGLPGVGAAETTSMGFIDGQAHGTAQTFGYFISAGLVAGTNSPADVTLEHETEYASFSIFSRYEMGKQDQLRFYVFGGPTYSHFLQEYLFATSGTNAFSGQQTLSETRETLYDYLFGGRFGVGTVIPVIWRVYLNLEEGIGLFFRHTQMRARQDITNAAGSTGLGAVFTALNEKITVRDRDEGFSPEFQSKVTLGIQPLKHVKAELFYAFDVWFNMSRIRNVLVAANFSSVFEDRTEIKSEHLTEQLLGGRLVIEF